METMQNGRLLMAFYGDDFTGSTDALEFLSRAGAKTVLFIEPPRPEQLARYEGLQAIGVAGMSRTMTPAEMEKELRPAFEALAKLNPAHVHYKVCSTFDSSAETGSIGKAIDIGAEVFKSSYVPLLVAVPIFGRYCLFGNLFARMGIGSEGVIHRLDRHPSMSKHPVTPADESDLRLHLAKQTEKRIGLFDILEVHKFQDQQQNVTENPKGVPSPRLSSLIKDGHKIILFDAVKEDDLGSIGSLIDTNATTENIIFSAGSSAIEMALGVNWQQEGSIVAREEWAGFEFEGPILIGSGSCSPVTSGQIKYALENGFAEIAIETEILASLISSTEITEFSAVLEASVEQYALKATAFIAQGKSVLIHTSVGNDDVRVSRTDEILKQKGFGKATTALMYGVLLGKVARAVAERTSLQRIIIAGGDTSSYAARAMGIEAVEMIAPLAPGAPLCKAYAPGSAIDTLQVAFKGGQVGKEDFFVTSTK